MTESVFIAGAAGLLGQNLILSLKAQGPCRIVAVDKHAANLAILRSLHPDVECIEADLAKPGAWRDKLTDATAVAMLQAQIGGLNYGDFIANSVTSTQLLLEAAEAAGTPHIVHVSSSVVNSMADDYYTRTKRMQETLVQASRIPHVTLRPTLMFGWFDRKHLGWLRRFMQSSPVFPIPGHGRFLRQPLYAGDFCAIIARCIERRMEGTYDITGLERIDYIDLIRCIAEVTESRTRILRIPYGLFRTLLAAYALFDRNPPFTVQQLEALVTPDVFDVIDWPGIFVVTPTPLRTALRQTFCAEPYARVALAF